MQDGFQSERTETSPSVCEHDQDHHNLDKEFHIKYPVQAVLAHFKVIFTDRWENPTNAEAIRSPRSFPAGLCSSSSPYATGSPISCPEGTLPLIQAALTLSAYYLHPGVQECAQSQHQADWGAFGVSQVHHRNAWDHGGEPGALLLGARRTKQAGWDGSSQWLPSRHLQPGGHIHLHVPQNIRRQKLLPWNEDEKIAGRTGWKYHWTLQLGCTVGHWRNPRNHWWHAQRLQLYQEGTSGNSVPLPAGCWRFLPWSKV